MTRSKKTLKAPTPTVAVAKKKYMMFLESIKTNPMRFLQVYPDETCTAEKLKNTFFDATMMAKVQNVIDGLMAEPNTRKNLEVALGFFDEKKK